MIRKLLINQKNKEKIALIENDKEVRYIDILRNVWNIQSLIKQNQEENIAIFLPNGSLYISALWGIFHAGKTAFPLNVLMTDHEVFPLLKQVSAHTVITIIKYQKVFEEIQRSGELSLNIIFIDKPIMNMPESDVVEINENKPILLLSTSGTTGRSKIVQLSEKNIETSVLGYLDKLRFNEANLENIRYTLAVPYSSVYGIMIISACLIKSFPLIVLDNIFTLDSLYCSAEKYGITHYEGSTSIILLMEQMVDRKIAYNIQTLKYFGFGGSKVAGSVITRILNKYPDMEFYQGYGMTEASPLISKHPQKKLEKTHSVGTAINGVEIAVEVNGNITNVPYTEGEIIVRGANVMIGYFDNKEETNNVLKNEYLYTGDIGYLDDEGYLYICGRKKNIIIVRGFNVYPEEVEICINNSKFAKDCFVYGKKDVYGGEVICADVVPIGSHVSEKEIREYCRDHLAEYKRPKKIFFCEDIKKNKSGKTERR